MINWQIHCSTNKMNGIKDLDESTQISLIANATIQKHRARYMGIFENPWAWEPL